MKYVAGLTLTRHYAVAALRLSAAGVNCLSWTQHTANARLHRTTGELPQARFERDERATLQVLASRPYRSVAPLQAPSAPQPGLPGLPDVQRRSLTIYSRIAGVRT